MSAIWGRDIELSMVRDSEQVADDATRDRKVFKISKIDDSKFPPSAGQRFEVTCRLSYAKHLGQDPPKFGDLTRTTSNTP